MNRLLYCSIDHVSDINVYVMQAPYVENVASHASYQIIAEYSAQRFTP
jgi:hypothetical protein